MIILTERYALFLVSDTSAAPGGIFFIDGEGARFLQIPSSFFYHPECLACKWHARAAYFQPKGLKEDMCIFVLSLNFDHTFYVWDCRCILMPTWLYTLVPEYIP